VTLGAVLGLAAGCGNTPVRTLANRRAIKSTSTKRAKSAKEHASPSPKTKSSPRPVPFASGSWSFSQPSLANPLKILVIGDSLGEDLQDGLLDIAGTSSNVTIIPAAVGSTGLANVAYYNWPKVLEQDLLRDHPQVVMVLIGGNDAVGFMQNRQPVEFATAQWRQAYGARVNSIIDEARQAKARIVWVGLPLMAKGSVLPNPLIQDLNAVYTSQVAKNPGAATFISTWSLFRTPDGQFAEYLPDSQGQSVMVRDPDGVHIAPPAGQELIAAYVMTQFTRLAHITVCMNGTNLWNQYSFPHCSKAP
jgi:hypothetical protein